MKKYLLVFSVLVALLLVGCTSKEEKVYDEQLNIAKEAIDGEAYEQAQKAIEKALESIPDGKEAKAIAKQLENYFKVLELLEEGQFDDVHKALKKIITSREGSPTLVSVAEKLKITTDASKEEYEALENVFNEASLLADSSNFEQSNALLVTVKLNQYEENYYEHLKDSITKLKKDNDKAIALLQEKKQISKKEAPKVEKAPTASAASSSTNSSSSKSLANMSDNELRSYFANYFNMQVNHILVEIMRNAADISVEVRQNNAAFGKGDPGIAPMLGFFLITNDGKLYEMDNATGEYIEAK